MKQSSSPQTDLIERIKKALSAIPEATFSKLIEQRAKAIVNVNSANPIKARALMSRPQFAEACQAQVTPLRKTIANGISLLVEDPEYGKPVVIRIRKGGLLARGVGNEAALVSIIDNAIQNGATSVVFKDSFGGSVTVSNMVSVRHVGNEAGSRMGNRADIEILDEAGVAHRISVKKDNFGAIAKVRRLLASRRLKIQKSLRDHILANGLEFPHRGLVAVPVKNTALFNFRWFGNDIDVHGGVVEGSFDANNAAANVSIDESKNAIVVKCTRTFSPNDDVRKLMSDKTTSAWLIMKITNKFWHTEIIGVYNNSMAKNYKLPGFTIDGVTNERVVESRVADVVTLNELLQHILEEG